MISNNISQYIYKNFKKKHYVFTGRATTALYLILKSYNVKKKYIICPVNLCYSIINAIVVTGNNPLFVDVDPNDGNMRYDFVREKINKDVFAILVPHMFGNPCKDVERIKELCVKNGIYLIEDCAVSIGGKFNGKYLGEFGDYTFFSFGDSKIINIGMGGMLISNFILDKMKKLNSQLPLFNKKIKDKIDLYSKLFRDIYYSNYYDQLISKFSIFNEFFYDIYLFRVENTRLRFVLKKLEGLKENISAREKIAEYYNSKINFSNNIKKYPYVNGKIYWRYNLLIDSIKLKHKLINKLLKNNILVSAWYPPINKLFNDYNIYKNAENFYKKILNIPVNINKEIAYKIVDTINSIIY